MFISKTISLYKRCKRIESNFIITFFVHHYYSIFYSKKLFTHHKVVIKGVENIETKFKLDIGMNYVGFIPRWLPTYLNVKGKLILNDNYCIGRGCRFDIAKKAVITIGKGGYINANCTFIIMHNLSIGDNTIISWDCQFLDEDFHVISYENKKQASNQIKIGNNVWIGCGVKIYKGSVIPDGSIIAADSIVRGVFKKNNVLIGGNPARIIKENVNWK